MASPQILVPVVAALALVASVAPAAADSDFPVTAKTTTRVVMRKRPARKGRRVAKIPAKRTVKVLSRKGGWARVRYRGKVGWVLDKQLRSAAKRSTSAAPAGKAIKPAIRNTAIATPLYAEPGESSKKLAEIPAGTDVTADRQAGRWFHVRHGKHQGWIARTTLEVDSNTPEKPGRAEHFAKTHSVLVDGERKQTDLRAARSFKAKLETTAHQGPSEQSRAVFEVAAGDTVVTAGRRDGQWVLVQNAAGLAGWVHGAALHRRVATDSTQDAEPVTPAETEIAEGAAARNLRERFRIATSARTGVMALSQRFLSDGTSEFAEYRVSANGLTVAAAADVSYRVGAHVRLGLDARYSIALGVPGIRYYQGDMALDPTSFSLQHGNVSAQVGYDLPTARATSIYLRAGYYLQWFQIDELDNPGRLSRESFVGATAGARVESALAEALLVSLAADLLPSGKRHQTEGLEDGVTRDAMAAMGALRVSYVGFGQTFIEGSYRFGWAWTQWSGPSTRQPDVSTAERTDTMHHILLGVGRVF